MNRIFSFLVFMCFSLHFIFGQGLYGKWEGKLKNFGLILIYEFQKTDGGEIICTLRVPQQTPQPIPSECGSDGNKVSIATNVIGAKYDGELKGDSIVGIFKQNGMEIDLVLVRKAEQKAEKSQIPVKPFPYDEEEIEVSRKEGNGIVKLSGTLTSPTDYDKKKHQVAVVLISGSGQQNRDEEVFGHRPFAVIADYLAKNGIATFRYDDRGVGKSVGDIESITMETNADDAQAVVDMMKKKFKHVGVIGHSEGGTISFILSNRGVVDFAVSMAGTGIVGIEIIKEQIVNSVKSMNLHEDIELESAINRLIEHKKALGAESNCVEISKSIFDDKDMRSIVLNKIAETLDTKSLWLNHFLKYDPQDDIKKVKTPIFALNGEKDTQVLSKTNLSAIEKLLPKNDKNKIKEYAGLNHLFQNCITGLMTEYALIEETISEEVLSDITSWIGSLF